MQETGSCWLVKFTPAESMNEITAEFLDEYFDVIAINYTDDGLEEYVGYKNNSFNEQHFIQEAQQRNIILPPYQIEFLESRNWLKENIIKFAPVNVEEFTIYGIHEQNIPHNNRLNLRIYAATAFGSEHQTTKSCLHAISDYNKKRTLSVHEHSSIGICSQNSTSQKKQDIDFGEDNERKSRSAEAERTLSVREHSSIGICSQDSTSQKKQDIDFGEDNERKSRSAEAERTLSVREHSSIGICSQDSTAQKKQDIDFGEDNERKSRSAEAERTLSVREHSSIGICSQDSTKINILDMGTGSGILSLACAKLWQEECKVIAVDIDEEAVNVTKNNMEENHLEKFITAAVSDGYKSELVKKNAPYDLIIANILARPLIDMAQDLYNSLKPGGFCILSGFVDEQEEWVIGEHKKYGLKVIKVYQMDNWRAVLMEK